MAKAVLVAKLSPIGKPKPPIGLAGIIITISTTRHRQAQAGTGRQAGQVLSSQDRAMSSNTKLFLSMSKLQKYFQTLTLIVMRPI